MNGKEFREKRLKLGLSQDKIAKVLGILKRQIINIEQSNKEIKHIYAEKISELFHPTPSPSSHHIPLLSARVSAGSGADNYEIEVLKDIPISEEYFKTKPKIKHLKALYVIGDSMYPTLNDSDIIVIDESIGFVSDGIYVIRMGNELRVKRLIRKIDGIEIKSDNTTYGIEFVKNDDKVGFNILGRVVLAIKRY